jgi:hypothetical protein
MESKQNFDRRERYSGERMSKRKLKERYKLNEN